jgi:CRP-like cAMP-binding protein
VPPNLFDRRRGIALAEIEFPAYYNFFRLGRRVRMVVDRPETADRLRRMMRESLGSAVHETNHEEFASSVPVAMRPDLAREQRHFRNGPRGTPLDVDDLVEFVVLDEHGRIVLDDRLVVALEGDRYAFTIDEEPIASVPTTVELPERQTPSFARESHFEPPDFGLTVLGASHGFDPNGKTTGFLLWLGRRGILIDPPVDTSLLLRDMGVMPKVIDGVILTHCHADHDSGVFGKLLEEGRTRLYTTPTILGSFLRKYSALSGISEEELRSTFTFSPVTIGAPTKIHGAELYFSYTLHSVPTIGFEAYYGGKSLAFSSDTLYEPDTIRKLCDAGVMTPERRDALIDFPWHHTLVFHEAGVPPLHTPLAPLRALPDEAKERLYLVHIAARDLPADSGLKAAPVGLDHTIRIDVDRPAHAEAIDVLNAFCAADLFDDLPLGRAGELLMLAKRRRFEAGQRIITEHDEGQEFYLLVRGTVHVMRGETWLKSYHSGDYFGETSLVMDRPRSADVVARTDVEVLTLDRHAFHYVLRGTDTPSRLVRLARARELRTWELLEQSSVLRELSSPQRTQLQTYLERVELGVGETLWREGDDVRAAFLIDEGQVEETTDADRKFASGALLADVDALREHREHRTTLIVREPTVAYRIDATHLHKFLEANPGVSLQLRGDWAFR